MNAVRLITGLCMIWILSIPSCADSRSVDTGGPLTDAATQPSFKTLQGVRYQGFPGNIKPQIHVIRNGAEWEKFLGILQTHQTEKPAIPVVDFATNVIVAAVDITRPSGGYSFTITKIEPSPTGVTVQVSQVSPGRNCMNAAVMSQPYHFVTTPVFSGEATLVLVPSVRNCGP